jgi:hypothetical protein
MLTFRNSKIVYYGPHSCDNCGAAIVKMGAEFGGTAFNAPNDYPYPNTEWHPHVCDPSAVAKLHTDAEKAGLEPSYATDVVVDVASSATDAPVGINADGTIRVNYTGMVNARRTNAISGQPPQRGLL